MRLIEAFVEGLDLQAARFARVCAKTMARPVYGPAGLAIHTKHKLVTEQKLINQGVDFGLLAPTVTAVMGTLDVETIKRVTDPFYFNFEDMPVAISATGTTTII